MKPWKTLWKRILAKLRVFGVSKKIVVAHWKEAWQKGAARIEWSAESTKTLWFFPGTKIESFLNRIVICDEKWIMYWGCGYQIGIFRKMVAVACMCNKRAVSSRYFVILASVNNIQLGKLQVSKNSNFFCCGLKMSTFASKDVNLRGASFFVIIWRKPLRNRIECL